MTPMFADPIVNQPLLTEAQINQLLNAAPIIEPGTSRPLSQRGRMGEQPATIKGSGTDFADFRGYHAGDDPRHIDWRATARSRIPLVRTYYSEYSQPVCLLIDRRASMRFATRARLKVTQALRMALWLGGREVRSGRELSALLLDSPCHWLPPQTGMRRLKLMAELANAPCPPIAPASSPQADQKPAHQAKWGKVLSGLQQRLPQGSELFLITDFSGLHDQDTKMLRMLAQHCKTTAIHIVDPSELSPVFPAAMQLQWGKAERILSTAATGASAQLGRELQARTETLVTWLRRANIDYYRLSVDQDELSVIDSEIQSSVR